MAEPGRLQRMLSEMDAVGATPAGGVHRPAATGPDGAARDLLRVWMEASGMQVSVDPIGNMAGLLELGIVPTPVELVVPAYLDRYRAGGGKREQVPT